MGAGLGVGGGGAAPRRRHRVEQRGRVAEVPARVLQAGHAGVHGQRRRDLGHDLDLGVDGDVVENQGQGGRVGEPGEVSLLLGRAERVVAGRRGQDGRAAVVGVGGDLGGGLRVVVREDTGNHRHPRGNRGGDRGRDGEPLLQAEAVALTGRAKRAHPGDAPVDQPFHQVPERSVIDPAVGVDRGDQGDDDTLKDRHDRILRSVAAEGRRAPGQAAALVELNQVQCRCRP